MFTLRITDTRELDPLDTLKRAERLALHLNRVIGGIFAGDDHGPILDDSGHAIGEWRLDDVEGAPEPPHDQTCDDPECEECRAPGVCFCGGPLAPLPQPDLFQSRCQTCGRGFSQE